ncbi:MAG: multicopper oxidase family protein [Hydrogenophaga sp.]|uniref:multicopper oxidase family protein n=1 Tax=Hydrogenophaga sp. TaxID=1904254 RepID=UPI001D430482|nr:multicopper oxidase family protein [Hydrogenophaga sp.]MBX3610498.1 multicopper oxidase family protein [Hydrogenophaga sp.]
MRRRELLQYLGASPVLALGGLAHASATRTLTAGSAALPVAGEAALPVWAYDAQLPGPVMRFKRGEWVDVDLHNRLPEATTVHWHGIRLPNAMDGVPHLTQPPVASGERFHYRFRLPDAGTYWYHPHLGTAEQLERGLAGALVVDDDSPPPVDDDLVWLLDDWRLDAQGRIAEDFYRFHDVAHAGRLGQRITVNGRVDTELPLRVGQRVRLRLINAANARIFALQPEAGVDAWLIGRDGMPTPAALVWDAPLLLGPGMRADVVIDARQAGRFAIQQLGGREAGALATVVVSGSGQAAARAAPEPSGFEPPPAPDLASAAVHTLRLGGGARSRDGWPEDSEADRQARQQRRQAGAKEADPAWTINGVAHTGDHHAHHAPAFGVTQGQSVRLIFENPTAWWHPLHLHGHHMRVLARNGTPLADATAWRDTVLLSPGDRVEVAFVADNPGRWLIHCHVLEHHAGGMGTTFEVAG